MEAKPPWHDQPGRGRSAAGQARDDDAARREPRPVKQKLTASWRMKLDEILAGDTPLADELRAFLVPVQDALPSAQRAWIQAWDFVGGTNWVVRMQDGTRGTIRMIEALLPDYLESVYGGAEWQAAWAADQMAEPAGCQPCGCGR
jgi:hypothetical protein